MRPWFTASHPLDDADLRREYAIYSAQRMAPMIRLLMILAILGYVMLLGISFPVVESHVPFAWRLAPALATLPIAAMVGRVRQPLPLSLLSLLSLIILEAGIDINGIGVTDGASWVMPGSLLLPVAVATVWSGRWDFIAAMVICGLGPLPMLLLGDATGMHIFRYVCYMMLALCLSTVLREFMMRSVLEQLRLEQKLRDRVRADGLTGLRLGRQSHLDDRTGLLMHNRFLALMRPVLDELRHARKPACLLYLDIRYSHQTHAQHGQPASDMALGALADCLREQMRDGDLIGRVSDAAFAVLLPGIELEQARIRANSLLTGLHAALRADSRISLSIGIARSQSADESADAMLARAHDAMHQQREDDRDYMLATAPIS